MFAFCLPIVSAGCAVTPGGLDRAGLPDGVEEVRIGWFGPTDPADSTTGMMWQAATLAIDEANASGGFHGVPFRLVPAWSADPWGTGVKRLTRLVYEDRVWAVTGAPDGPTAHLTAQVVAKARLAFISPVATDKTTNLAKVPWVFSVAPGDHLLAASLTDAMVSYSHGASINIVSCTDHDSRVFVAELLAALGRRSTFPGLHVEFKPGATDFVSQLRSLHRPQTKVTLAIIAGAADTANCLSAVRQAGLTMPVYGGPSMGRRAFCRIAGDDAEGVVFPLLGELPDTFTERFRARFNCEPDCVAAHTYDAVSILVDAIRRAGLDRDRISETVRERSPWTGVTGAVTWSEVGQNVRRIGLGTIADGKILRLDIPESRGSARLASSR